MNTIALPSLHQTVGAAIERALHTALGVYTREMREAGLIE